jgi:internalin A
MWIGELGTFITIFFLVSHMAKEIVDIDIIDGSICSIRRGIDDETKILFHSCIPLKRAMDRVTSVTINEENLTEVPRWIEHFRNLEVLTLFQNKINRFGSSDIDFLHTFPKLQMLGLGDNFIRKLPDNLSILTFLRNLDVSSNGLSFLPRTLSELEHLITLECGSRDMRGFAPSDTMMTNKFRIFPHTILHLKGLRELFINNVDMNRFPETQGSELVALLKLNISDNPIDELPSWLFPGTSMRELNASGTRIAALPDCIVRWKYLEVLDISGTRIEALPETIGELKQLRVLRARDTPLMALPEAIGGCERLEVLDINGTKMRELPASLGSCSMLRDVDINRTTIDTLPGSLGECWNLERIQYRTLRAIPPEIQRLRERWSSKLQLVQDWNTALVEKDAEEAERMRRYDEGPWGEDDEV